MARRARQKRAARKPAKATESRAGWLRRLLRWPLRLVAGAALLVAVLILVFAVVRPPFTHTIVAEWWRLGAVERDWVRADRVAPVMLRAVVAAEDANFCLHWGFDMAAIRTAIDDGGGYGASTLSQQTVKNVFLWQGRSWTRKALEALITPAVEVVWTKRRILEVYLNVAEFGEGVFGVEAAARHYYGVGASDLTPVQAARLAVLLPNPKRRDPGALSASQRRRAAQVLQGAETIRLDGRAKCFES